MVGLDPGGHGGLALITLGIALGAAFGWRALREPPASAARVLASTALVLLLLLLFSRKAYATYLALALFPLCFVVACSAPRRVRVAYLTLAALTPLEPSLWFRWFPHQDLRAVWAATHPHAGTFLCVEFALVVSYAVLLAHAFNTWRRAD